jgi:hypothetical protein
MLSLRQNARPWPLFQSKWQSASARHAMKRNLIRSHRRAGEQTVQEMDGYKKIPAPPNKFPVPAK